VIEQLGDGRVRVTSPALVGWVIIGRGADTVVRAVSEGFRELAVARYAASRGVAYDLSPLGVDEAGDRHPRTRRAGRVYRRAHDPADWTPLPDGSWRAPGGASYPPMAAVVARVIAARAARGLSTCHPDAPEDVESQWERWTSPVTGKAMWRRRRPPS